MLSLIDQVAEFTGSIASRPAYAPWTGENALFGVWMGVNDVGNSWWLEDYEVLLGRIMDSYFGQLGVLYEKGARKFVLLTVPREFFFLSFSLPFLLVSFSFLAKHEVVPFSTPKLDSGCGKVVTDRHETNTPQPSTKPPPFSPTPPTPRPLRPSPSQSTTTPLRRGWLPSKRPTRGLPL